jgi:hypothetical protein
MCMNFEPFTSAACAGLACPSAASMASTLSKWRAG